MGTLIFDGDCGFCTSSARAIARVLPRATRIIPWQRIVGELASHGLTPAEANESVWWIADDGSTSHGSRAIAEALETSSAPLRLAGRAMGSRAIQPVAEGVYRIVARNRHRLPGGTPACRLDE